MSENFNQEVMGLVEEHLPKMTSDALKKRLDKIDDLETRNLTYRRDMKDLTERIDNQEKLIEDLKTKEQTDESLIKREEEVSGREFKQELLSMEVVFTNTRMEDVKQMFNTVFANNLVKKSVHTPVPVAASDSGMLHTGHVQIDEGQEEQT